MAKKNAKELLEEHKAKQKAERQRRKPTARVPRPPCPKCSTKMERFEEGRTDTWICTNPSCTNFDIRLKKYCPACGTARIKTEAGIFVCLNPNCGSFKGDILSNAETRELEEELEAGRNGAAAALQAHRAKKGQGTQAAARGRRRARAKARKAGEPKSDIDEAIDAAFSADMTKRMNGKGEVKVEGLGEALRHNFPRQSLIALPVVERKVETTTYEIYRDIGTQLMLRRKQPYPIDPDPLTGKGVDEDKKLTEAQKLAKIEKSLKGSKWSARTAEGVAPQILKAVNGEKVNGIDVQTEDVHHIVWRSSYWTVKDGEEGWQGDKGRKPKWQAKLAKARKHPEAQAKKDAVCGEVRVYTQDRMKKTKKVLVDGELFEAAYVALYKKIYREVNPDDDKDPKGSAPSDEWLRAALPDKAQA